MNRDPLNLRDLPAPRPPDDLWPSIEAEMAAAAKRRPRRYLPLAVAASLALAAGSGVLFNLADDPATPAMNASAELQQARAASARLEQELRRQRNGLLDASSTESLTWMEQELGWLDIQLADSPSDTHLWEQRANLLAEMAGQYQRNNWQSELRFASY